VKALLSMKRLRAERKRISFFSSLDLLNVEEDGQVIGVSGRTGYGYRLSGVDYLLQDDLGIESFLYELKKFLNQIPEGIVLSFQRRSNEGDPELINAYQELIPKDDSLASAVLEAKKAALRNQRFLKKELFLFVSYLAKGEKKKFWEKNQEQENIHNETKKILLNVESLIIAAFKPLEIKIERLSKIEIIKDYFQKLNPTLSRLVPYNDIFRNDMVTHPRFETFRSRLLLHPPKVSEESFYLDGFHHAVANLRTLPEEAAVGMVKRFERSLPDSSEWLLTIRKPDEEKEIHKMRVSANFARAGVFFRIAEDHLAREGARQYEAFLEEMAARGESIFEISLSILVKDETIDGLLKKKEAILKAFPKLGGSVGIVDHFEHDRLFLTHLMLQGDENPLKFPVLTEALTRILPLGEEWKGTEKPEILLKTYQDEGLSLDLFDPSLPAKHGLVIGSTGSGKSFSANFILSHFLIASPKNHVVVVDVGGSYRKLSRIFGGSYLEIDCSDEYALNPFFEKKRLFPKAGEFDSDLLAFLTTLVEKMVTEYQKLTTGDLRILERAILQVYKNITDRQIPLLQDVQNVLRNYSLGDEEDRRRAYHFSKNLGIWTEGRFGKLLNRPGTLSLYNRLLVFDLAKLSAHPELQSILFFVIRGALTRKLDDLSLRKMLVFDECWRFSNDEVGSRLIEELYRTGRKTASLILSLSQSPEDFLQSKASTAILANSYVKYVLKLQKGHELLSHFDLNPNEIKASRELEVRPGIFSEMFIKFFNRSVIAKIEPSGLDYWIATTDPEDFLEEENLRRKKPNLTDLEILKELAKNFPHGVKKLSFPVEANLSDLEVKNNE